MQLENQKIQTKNSKGNLLFFILSAIIVCAIAVTLIIIYLSLKDLNLKIKSEDIKNQDYKLAEEYFNNGYLEDSEKYYRKYLQSNPEKLYKTNTYRKLFEISIIGNNNDKALLYLKEWQSIDKKNPNIFIDRLKLYLRLDQLANAKEDINANYNAVKQFSEYTEIVGVYFIKAGFYDKALNEFSNISFNKREFSLHEKIILCYLKLNKLNDAKNYIKKIEPKIKALDLKENISQFYIIKSITLILNNEIDKAYDQLQSKNFTEKYRGLSLKLLLYCDVILDRPKEIAYIIENNESDINFDAGFSSIIGDYYIFKNDYNNALYFYEKIMGIRDLTQAEVMTLADIYYKTGDYNKSIETIQKLYKDYNYRSPLVYKNLSMNYKNLLDEKNEYFYLKEGINFYPEDSDFYVLIAKKFIDNNESNKALKVIDEGSIAIKDKNLNFDRRLEILKIIALQNDKKSTGEKELLLLREKDMNTPEYYFKLIEQYLRDKRLVDAKREIETVEQLPLSDLQKENLNTYKLVFFSMDSDTKVYNEIKNTILKSKSENVFSKINISVIKIKDREYDDALDVLNTINYDNENIEILNKINYLKAVVYYFKKDYPSSYKLIQNILKQDSSSKKASYLKSLIDQL